MVLMHGSICFGCPSAIYDIIVFVPQRKNDYIFEIPAEQFCVRKWGESLMVFRTIREIMYLLYLDRRCIATNCDKSRSFDPLFWESVSSTRDDVYGYRHLPTPPR